MKSLKGKNVLSPEFKWNLLQHFLSYKYTILYASVILLFAVMPFVEQRKGVVVPLFILFMLLAILHTLDLHRLLFLFCIGLGVVASVCHIVYKFWSEVFLGSTLGFTFIVFALSAYSVFLGIAILTLGRNMFSETNVSGDTIRGGVAIYFLMGTFWAFLYQLLLLFDPNAISIPEHGQFSTILYFSFTTLTTLGYGDIAPLTHQARSLAMLEAAAGPIYMTVFIARLVGLHLTAAKK